MNQPENTERLFELDNMLDGAGSDSASMTLSNTDAELLGIADSKEEVTEHFTPSPVADENHKLIPQKSQTRNVKAVVPHEPPAQGFTVNVGFARRALKKKLGNRSSEKRQPEAPMPQVEEPIPSEA